MKTILPKNHRYKNYVGRNGIEVLDLICLDYTCFSPHNFNYTLSNGKIVNRWVCRIKELNGCPEHPIKEVTC